MLAALTLATRMMKSVILTRGKEAGSIALGRCDTRLQGWCECAFCVCGARDARARASARARARARCSCAARARA